jgi:hypothetical protein
VEDSGGRRQSEPSSSARERTPPPESFRASALPGIQHGRSE